MFDAAGREPGRVIVFKTRGFGRGGRWQENGRRREDIIKSSGESDGDVLPLNTFCVAAYACSIKKGRVLNAAGGAGERGVDGGRRGC